MKLITEVTEEIHVLTEGSGANKHYFIEGVFLQGNIKNKNNRVYPIDILGEEADKYVENFVKKNRAFGELGHPDSPHINLERCSHMIKELYREDDNYIGRAKILDTPYGKIVKNLIDEGARLGVSSRGLGSLQERDGVSYVGNDFHLATAADIVADPSAPDAFVRGICEGREWIYESGVLVSKEIDAYKKQIKDASRRTLEEVKLNAFKDFLQKLG